MRRVGQRDLDRCARPPPRRSRSAAPKAAIDVRRRRPRPGSARARRCAGRPRRSAARPGSRARARSRWWRRAGRGRRARRGTRATSSTCARERADLVERRGERDDAVAADAAVGRLEADHAAERGRLPDRPAGVGAERERRHARGHRRRGAARRAAGHARRGPRDCASVLNALFSVDEPIANSSMLVLPTTMAPARLEPRHRGGGERRAVALEDARAARGGEAGHVEDVLHRERDAREGPGVGARAARRRAAAPARAPDRRSTARKASSPRLAGGDAVEVRARHLLGRDLAAGDTSCDLGGAEACGIAHPRGRAERGRGPSAASGRRPGRVSRARLARARRRGRARWRRRGSSAPRPSCRAPGSTPRRPGPGRAGARTRALVGGERETREARDVVHGRDGDARHEPRSLPVP